jgi:tRNA(Ile)-lysidine synthase
VNRAKSTKLSVPGNEPVRGSLEPPPLSNTLRPWRATLLNHVAQTILKRKLLRRAQSVLVGVSGGVDSLVLLHVLARLAHIHRWSLTVAHFNHQLRGRSSRADEALVRRTAAKLGLACVVEQGDVRTCAQQSKLSLEMAGRELRHDFLARVARQRRIRTIALAHHADDQVELFFLRLLRGAGTEGLAGMRWRSPSMSDARITLVRPLLDQPKEALLSFAREEGIAFREDRSNALPDFLRNRLRHQLLPLLRKHYQPALNKVVLRQMEILGAEADFLDHTARQWLRGKLKTAFTKLPLAVQRRCLRWQLLEFGVAPAFELIERLREDAGRPVTVGPNAEVYRDIHGRIHWRRATRFGFDSREQRLELKGQSGSIHFGSLVIQWRIVRAKSVRPPKRAEAREYFDADKVGSPVTLRHWRAGDRFQPSGMKAAVKLQDLFTNWKIPRARRHALVVATTACGEIWWVEGCRISELFKLSATTKRRLEWRWRAG